MIAFLFSPLGRAVGIAALIILALFAAGRTGYNYAARACQEASLRAELATVRQDLEIAKRSETEAKAIAEENEATARTNRERVLELERQEADRPPLPKGCPSPNPADYDRLRRIR